MVDVVPVMMTMMVVGCRHGGVRTEEHRTECDNDCREGLVHETNSLT
jgi:hypothetical protein